MTFVEVGPDILKVQGLLDTVSIVNLLAEFDRCDFTLLNDRNKDLPPSLLEYYKDLPGPEMHWIPPNTNSDAIIFSYTKLIVQALTKYYSGFAAESDEGYRFNRYPKGHGYKLHVDKSPLNEDYRKRCTSVIYNLNETYTGGELHFPRQNTMVELRSGDLLCFPSCYTHPHEVLPVTSGIRKSVVTWLR